MRCVFFAATISILVVGVMPISSESSKVPVLICREIASSKRMKIHTEEGSDTFKRNLMYVLGSTVEGHLNSIRMQYGLNPLNYKAFSKQSWNSSENHSVILDGGDVIGLGVVILQLPGKRFSGSVALLDRDEHFAFQLNGAQSNSVFYRIIDAIEFNDPLGYVETSCYDKRNAKKCFVIAPSSRARMSLEFCAQSKEIVKGEAGIPTPNPKIFGDWLQEHGLQSIDLGIFVPIGTEDIYPKFGLPTVVIGYMKSQGTAKTVQVLFRDLLGDKVRIHRGMAILTLLTFHLI
jgi:hypothetical protein